jgi:hypothetical protein
MRHPRRTRPDLMALTGALATGLATTLLSNDCCSTALVATLAGAIVGWVAEKLAQTECLAPWGLTLRKRLLGMIVVGVALSFCFRLTATSAFDLAFGFKPPPGITEIVAERHYAGGPGDKVMLLRFKADANAIQQLLASGKIQEQPSWFRDSGQGEPWSDIWMRFAGGMKSMIPEDWSEIEPMSAPKYYEAWPRFATRTHLLWDAATGRAYVIYTLG